MCRPVRVRSLSGHTPASATAARSESHLKEMRRRLILITCLLVLIVNAGFAQRRTQSGARTVPLEVSRDGHICLRVRVNVSAPVLLGLDSGFEQSAITAKQ